MIDGFEDRQRTLLLRFQVRAAADAVTLGELSVRLEQGPSSKGQIQQISHRLAGAGGTFGFAGVSNRAAELGNLIVGSASNSEVAQGCRSLIAEIKHVCSSVTQRSAPAGWGRRLALVPAAQTLAGTEIFPVEPETAHENRVGVLASGENYGSLAAVIASLGYTAIDLSVSSAVEHSSSATVIAVVIGDDVEGWMKIARQLTMEVPVLLISTRQDFHGRLAAARVGVSGILSKPLDAFDLADWLDEFASRKKTTSFSVLLVEDDEILAETYALALTRAGMRTVIVSDASSVLECMEASPPDLILLDIQLPGVNGVELARIIRQSRRDLWLPIVFLSGESDPALQMEARKQGGDDFIVKPVDPTELVSLVRLRANRAAALRSLMEKDSLTGLLNHARFNDRLVNELERCRRTGAQVSLAMLDLDHFKHVNDTHGHMSGDRVIRALAHTLTGGLRRIDIVGRYGGEEFGIILLDSPPEAATLVIDRIRQSFSEIPFGKTDETFNVTLSAGLAGSRTYPTAELLVAAADHALYAAKSGGRNRVALARDRVPLELLANSSVKD